MKIFKNKKTDHDVIIHFDHKTLILEDCEIKCLEFILNAVYNHKDFSVNNCFIKVAKINYIEIKPYIKFTIDNDKGKVFLDETSN